MDGLKCLSDVLKLQKSSEPLVFRYELEQYGCFASGKVIGYQKLNDDNLHLLCFDNEIYVYDLDKVVYSKKPFADAIVAYHFVENFAESKGSNVPVHIFVEDNGMMFFYKFDFTTRELEPICNRALGGLSLPQSQTITTCSKNRLYIFEYGNAIFEWKYDEPKASLEYFLPMKKGVLHFCAFLQDDSIFISFYQSLLNGEAIVEFFQNSTTRKGFKPVKRISLGALNLSSTILKKESDQLILCLTIGETWNLRSDINVFSRRNVGLPINARIFSISENHMRKFIHLHTSEGVYETTHRNLYLAKVAVNWSPKDICGISRVGTPIVDFSYDLQEDLHVIIYAKGLIKLVSSSTSQSSYLGCNYDNKCYFAGQIPFSNGSCLTTILLGGASGDRYGFFEKRFPKYPQCMPTGIFSRLLSHSPINNIWATTKGLFYESMGTIYNSDFESDNGEKGTWVSIQGDIIKDTNEDILFLESSGSCKEGLPTNFLEPYNMFREINTGFVTVIRTNGLLELMKYNEQSHPLEVLKLHIEGWIDHASVISTSYNSQMDKLHLVAFLDYHKIYYWNSLDQSFAINVEPGFQLAGLLMFERDVSKLWNLINRTVPSSFIVATSFDGQIRIYSIENRKIVLEIKSTHNNEFQMAKLTDYLIFYNDFEVIMLEKYSLKYGLLPLSKKPRKIVPLERNRFCYLDNFCNVDFQEVEDYYPSHQSQFYDFHDYIPLKMLLMPEHNNLVAMALKKNSNNVGIRLVLFDFFNMEVLKSYHWDVIASNILLEPYFDGLILSYYDGNHTIVKTFNSEMNFMRMMSFEFVVTSLGIEIAGSDPMRPYLRLEGSEGISFNIPDDIFGTFDCGFNYKKHSNYRAFYEATKRPEQITWDTNKYESHQATDVDLLKDFIRERQKPIIPNPNSYRLHLSFGNQVSIDTFKKVIPYEILNVTPVNEFMCSIQNGESMSLNNRPLFLITCSNNAIYILSAKYERSDGSETEE